MTASVTVENNTGETRTVQTQTAQTAPNEQQRFVFIVSLLFKIENICELDFYHDWQIWIHKVMPFWSWQIYN